MAMNRPNWKLDKARIQQAHQRQAKKARQRALLQKLETQARRKHGKEARRQQAE
jgi:hypothetical protein